MHVKTTDTNWTGTLLLIKVNSRGSGFILKQPVHCNYGQNFQRIINFGKFSHLLLKKNEEGFSNLALVARRLLLRPLFWGEATHQSALLIWLKKKNQLTEQSNFGRFIWE